MHLVTSRAMHCFHILIYLVIKINSKNSSQLKIFKSWIWLAFTFVKQNTNNYHTQCSLQSMNLTSGLLPSVCLSLWSLSIFHYFSYLVHIPWLPEPEAICLLNFHSSPLHCVVTLNTFLYYYTSSSAGNSVLPWVTRKGSSISVSLYPSECLVPG